jgi:hypothetical protein
MLYENQLLRKGNAIPLDYIVSSIGKPISFKNAKKRKNILKNTIFNRVLEIREKKKRPKLGDFLKIYKTSGINKNIILKKLKQFY